MEAATASLESAEYERQTVFAARRLVANLERQLTWCHADTARAILTQQIDGLRGFITSKTGESFAL